MYIGGCRGEGLGGRGGPGPRGCRRGEQESGEGKVCLCIILYCTWLESNEHVHYTHSNQTCYNYIGIYKQPTLYKPLW